MAENTVVKEQLTGEMIEAGERLTNRLAEMGLAIAAAMWFFLPDTNEWRLVFASSEVDVAGPREVYQKVQQALQSLGEDAAAVPFSSIHLLDANHLLVRVLRAVKDSGASLPLRISREVTNGQLIEDAYVYRVE